MEATLNSSISKSDFKKNSKLTSELASVYLVSDLERAKADGIRAQFKVLADFLAKGSKDSSASKEIKDGVGEIRNEYNNRGPVRKISYLLSLPISGALTLGIGAAVCTVRSIDFLRRLREGRKFQDEMEDLGLGDDLNNLINEAQNGNASIDPYSSSSYSSGAASMFSGMIEEKGGRTK